MAHHPKLTEESLAKLVSMVRSGTPIKTALRAEGIHEKAAERWLRNARERPGSIYGAFRDQITRAKAEADVVDIQILANAKTRTSRRVTTVTKHEAHHEDGVDVMRVAERTVTEVELPPEPIWAWRMLQARNPAFRTNAPAVDVTVNQVPHDVMARTIAEKLRLVQGGEGPSMLAEGDSEIASFLQG